MKKYLKEGVTILLTLSCLVFVVYQAQKCIQKFKDNPRSTDVSIEKAAKHDYPDLTFCHAKIPLLNSTTSGTTKLFSNKLKKCVLTMKNYLLEHQWVGNDSCPDPKELYLDGVGNVSDLIQYVKLVDFDGKKSNLDITDEQLIQFKDISKYMRCFTLNLPRKNEIHEVQVKFIANAVIFIHSHGSSLDQDWKMKLKLNGNKYITSDIMYDSFQVLDFDGEVCNAYESSRDDCIQEATAQISMTQVGCTTPYRPDKSNICTDPEKGKQANNIYKKVEENQTFAASLCPRSCMYQIISLSRFEIGEGQPLSATNLKADKRKTLTLTFQKFIKISKSRRSYTFLELIAEVGGYVGLFLGISINQTFDLTWNGVKTIYTLSSKLKP